MVWWQVTKGAWIVDLYIFFVDHYGCLGGGNSNIFYFHPETWGRFSPNFDVCISAYFSDGLVETNQPDVD